MFDNSSAWQGIVDVIRDVVRDVKRGSARARDEGTWGREMEAKRAEALMLQELLQKVPPVYLSHTHTSLTSSFSLPKSPPPISSSQHAFRISNPSIPIRRTPNPFATCQRTPFAVAHIEPH